LDKFEINAQSRFRCLLQSKIDQNTKVRFVHNNRSQHSEYHCTQEGINSPTTNWATNLGRHQLGGKTIRRREDASVTSNELYC